MPDELLHGPAAELIESYPLAIDDAALRQARVAVVHYWLVEDAGGEKVVKELLALFPQADVFTLVHKPEVSAAIAPGRRITASFLQRIPGVTRFYRKLLPLMPYALESLDLSGYDLILSSESGPAKGVVAPLGSLHVCYCHSPMRYLWDQAHDYRAQSGRLTRLMMTLFGPGLRLWDFVGAQRVDMFIANSRHVRQRIATYYRRDATVIPPPVDVSSFAPGGSPGDFYLITGRHVAYKRIDLAIGMANALGRRLVITGAGPETARLQRIAGDSVDFRGRVSREELAQLYRTCRAFLMPGEEDFGITPIEAMASGRPVIAFARGGALDSVVPGLSGMLFEEQSIAALSAAVERFEADDGMFSAQDIARHAGQFAEATFRARLSAAIVDAWHQHASRDATGPQPMAPALR